MRSASLNDVPSLVTMMAEFYSGSAYTLNPRRGTEAFTALLADERRGLVWFVQSDEQDVGYVVLTICHSMTFGGLVGIVDDFFIRSAFRGLGLGKAAMRELRTYCESHGIRALQVETGRDNGPALTVYRHAGFVENDFVHMTLGLAEPTHTP